MDIDELTGRVADHLAGRPVKIVWDTPPASGAVGQTIKTADGDLIIYIAHLEGIDSRFKIYLHECAHCRLDYSFIPVSDDHKQSAGSVKQSDAARQAWRGDPREKRAQVLADDWLEYANKHAPDYWRVDRSAMVCKLLALLDWSE